jgi:hypothetical protein
MAKSRIPQLIRRRPINLSLPPRSLDQPADLTVHVDRELHAVVFALDEEGVELVLPLPAAINFVLNVIGAIQRLQSGDLQ